MTATARQINVTAEDLAGGQGGGAYAELEVPGDYEAILREVSDYDKRKEGKSWGWIFEYEVETPSGKMVTFKAWLSFGQNARWKLIEVLEAHDVDMSEGLNNVDPNALVDDVIGVHIDFPRDKETDEPTSEFRELRAFFPLTEAPAVPETETSQLEERLAAEEPDVI